jgi:hypothetical protein
MVNEDRRRNKQPLSNPPISEFDKEEEIAPELDNVEEVVKQIDPVPVTKTKSESLYLASELVENSRAIAQIPRHMAIGAMKSANIDLKSKITRKAFIDACEAFKNAKAF